MTDPSEPGATEPGSARVGSLTPGARVEVRTGLDRSWTTGFEVAEHTGSGYRLRRRSDGEVLPVEFAFDDVRRERKKAMWWY